ncbi:hypothetical protein G7B40_029500 [Aetokthonos hydrillicola Thurmond2011]|uniref:Uncharacterized protein n=2 Tax=Aetokthonos TaxID=1550243 RepID=A0AAP5ICJ5_9CYAN|nr:hypothetical protein [Aetokthonos hydrillicola]MBO3462510.1 hypothetical protein [Aetokthonos hydrillicola CCALA 1050]MDR9898664.1 hypothetical protein [Aetokthonos hydrillicola Thurmond2011]
MKNTSLLSGITLLATVGGLGVTTPSLASGVSNNISAGFVSEQPQLLQTPSKELIAARRCYIRRVYHRGRYTRKFGIVGRKQYRSGYYTSERVCR